MPSIKLSVTVRSTLARKYSAASLAAIRTGDFGLDRR